MPARALSPPRNFFVLTILLLAITGIGHVSAGDTTQTPAPLAEDDLDYINLAAVMLRDGHFERAASMLSQVDLKRPGLDLKTYYTVAGLLQKQRKAYKEAIASLEQAIAHGQHDEIVFFYLAQCYWGLERWERVIHEVKNAGDAGRAFPQSYLLRAGAELKLQRDHDAWETLSAGARRHPEEVTFLRQKTFLLIRLGLHQEAGRLAQTYFDRIDPEAADYIALATAFRQADPARAKELLELARLRFPADPQIARHLAHAYIDSGYLRAAGDLLQLTAGSDDALMRESGELFKRAGAYERALYMNAGLVSQADKFRQRAAILVAQGEFERVAALGRRLERLGVLKEDQDLVYALAYAKFKIGDMTGAETLLRRIDDPKLFGHATGIRRMIEICRETPDVCP